MVRWSREHRNTQHIAIILYRYMHWQAAVIVSAADQLKGNRNFF